MSEEAKEPTGLYRPVRGSIILALALLAIRSLSLVFAGISIGVAIDAVENGSPPGLAVIWLAVSLFVAVIAGFAGPHLAGRIGNTVESDLHQRVLRVVLGDPSRPKRTGEIVTKATEGVAAVGALAGTFLPQLIGGVVIPILICLVALFIDVPTGLILLVTVPAIPLLLRGMEKRFSSVTGRYQKTADRLSAAFYDGIVGLPTLRSLGAAERYGRGHASTTEELRAETMALLRVNQVALLAVDTLFTLGTVVAAAVTAAWRVSDGAMTAGEAVVVILLGVALIEPLTQIGRFFYVGAIGRRSAADIKTFLADRTSSPTMRAGDGGGVDLTGVSVTRGETRILDDVSLHVAPGESVAVVGKTGAGKTTIGNVIAGLLAPSTGESNVHGRVAVVSQHPFLMDGSIRENLALADPNATDEEMWAVLEAVELAAPMRGRAEDLDLLVGERGRALSGGEAQRLTVARMLLVDAPIVVLDEPTANVDVETEARMQRSLDRLTRERTLIVIAHRLSTVSRADRVVLVEGGRVISTGPADSPEGREILAGMVPG